MTTQTKTILQNFLVYPIMFFLCLEIALRILGYQHFRNDDYSIQCTPPNAFVGDPKKGIALNPGTYRINLNRGLTFETRHLANGSRYVANRTNDTLEVLLLGCSFTYGYGVNDEENFASILQQSFPETGVQNGGVVGYGSIQSLMQLKEQMDSNQLKVVLLHFSSFHFMRNSLSQQYRSNLKIGYQRSSQHVDNLMQEARFPYKNSCEEPISFVSWEDMYENWPGRDWLAAVNWIQTSVDKAAEDQEQQLDVTACILHEINDLCEQKGIKFGLVCLDSTPETEQLKTRMPELNWLDVKFDFTSKKLTNQPYDSHPSPRGHEFITNKIRPFLGRLLDGE
jgi:hypothetical protein